MCLCSNRFQIPRRTTDQFRVLCVLSSRAQFLFIYSFCLTNYYAVAKKTAERVANFRKKREVRRRGGEERTILQKTRLRLMEVIHFRTNCFSTGVKSKSKFHLTRHIYRIILLRSQIYIGLYTIHSVPDFWFSLFSGLFSFRFFFFLFICYFYGFSALITDWDINRCVLFLCHGLRQLPAYWPKKWFDQIMWFDRFPFGSLAPHDSIWSSGEGLAPKEKRIVTEKGERAIGFLSRDLSFWVLKLPLRTGK